MIDVLIVEDSAVVRAHLAYLLGADPALRVIGTASTGEEAIASVRARRPHVILMDIHMPGMGGFEATREIMATTPVPIVIVTSTMSFSEVSTAMRAMTAGALAVTKKPGGLGSPHAAADAAELITLVKLMSEVKVVRRSRPTPPQGVAPLPQRLPALPSGGISVVAIGASTGGPPAIHELLLGLPKAFPIPILIVQHITPGFTQGFADWLSGATGFPVHVASDGEGPLPGHVYVAPDDRHLTIGPFAELRLSGDEPVNGLRPSVSVLFRSVAERHGRRAVGVLLTGMGKDGAAELKSMADAGAITVAQDLESSIVHGMPGEAIALGGARYVLSPPQIAAMLISLASPLSTGARP